MGNNEYSRDFVKRLDVQQDGGTVIINPVGILPDNMDYADEESVKMLASSAVHTADGFYDLIKGNCDTSKPDPSGIPHMEMFLALSGLACEIYMKAIIYHENIHGKKQVKGHKLDDLFEKLPYSIQEAIIGKVTNIREILPAIRDMFTTLRYDFEQNHICGDYLVIFKLMEELRTIAHTYSQKIPGSVKSANGVIVIN